MYVQHQDYKQMLKEACRRSLGGTPSIISRAFIDPASGAQFYECFVSLPNGTRYVCSECYDTIERGENVLCERILRTDKHVVVPPPPPPHEAKRRPANAHEDVLRALHEQRRRLILAAKALSNVSLAATKRK